jgi:L-alanine-DL-glutamate epimerase-like enolase superfamily enzyme
MKLRRREFLAMPFFLQAPLSTDARISELRVDFEDFLYRAPYKFGGKEVDRVTVMNVHLRIHTKVGKSAAGFASMPLGNVWSFPDPNISYNTTLAAMKSLAQKMAATTRQFPDFTHPLEANRILEPAYFGLASEVNAEMRLPTRIPKLCTLVTASSIDAAFHDAFGRLHGRNSFAMCGPQFLRWDLSHYLNNEFRGESLEQYISPKAAPRIQMFHSVGASDPLTAADVKKAINDGLPESLEAWIPYSGVTAIKIKLNGADLAWDVDRVASIDRVTAAAQTKRGVTEWIYSLDFNERCPNVQYLLDFEHQLKSKAPAAFDKVQYIEQPTARDLAANRDNTMVEAAKLRPVVIDESLVGLDSLLLAREMGYTGVALKACKGQSQSLLMAAAAQKYKMFRCVQDLTCPGAALVQSAGIASHVPGVTGIEANAREYVPSASKGWEKRFPGIFDVRNGYLDTSELDGVGLCTSQDA